jgi:Flp pilus assembly protein TadD
MRRTALLVMVLALGGCATLFGPKRSDTFEARKRLTRELVARQDWSAAFFYASQLHQEAPEDAEVLVLRGIIYRERGLPTEAEADLKDALKREDRLPEANAALGLMYDMTNRGDQAEPYHRRAVAQAADNPNYLNNLGFSLFLRHKNREAIEAYQQAVRLNPTSGRIRTNLGFAYAALGDLPRASREFDMGAPPAESRNNLGFAYEQRGDLTNAYSLYVEAVRLDPANGHARANLVYVAQKLGKEIPGDLPKAPGEARSSSK